MRDVAHLVAGDFESQEKLDGDGTSHQELHRNHDGKRDEPNLPVRKEDSRGDQYAKNCPGGADRGYSGGIRESLRVPQHIDQNADEPRARSRQKVVLIKALRSPGSLQVQPKKIEKQHVENEVPDPLMQEQVGNELPKVEPVRDVVRNEPKEMVERDCVG